VAQWRSADPLPSLVEPAGLAAPALPLLHTAPAPDLPPALAADVPTRSSQIACVHDFMRHHFFPRSTFVHCWRMASYLHMAKLLARNALLVVAVGRTPAPRRVCGSATPCTGGTAPFFTNWLHVVLLLLL